MLKRGSLHRRDEIDLTVSLFCVCICLFACSRWIGWMCVLSVYLFLPLAGFTGKKTKAAALG